MKLIVVTAEYYHDALSVSNALTEALSGHCAVHMHGGDVLTGAKLSASLEIARRADVLVIVGGYVGPNVKKIANTVPHWSVRTMLAEDAEDLLRIGREEGWDEWPELEPVPEAAPEVNDPEVVTVYDPDAPAAPIEEIPF